MLYLEAQVRRARQLEKQEEEDNKYSFQPQASRIDDDGGESRTDAPRPLSLAYSSNRDRRVDPESDAYSVSAPAKVSRHDLLYMDGERKRIQNLNAHYDPSTVSLLCPLSGVRLCDWMFHGMLLTLAANGSGADQRHAQKLAPLREVQGVRPRPGSRGGGGRLRIR